MAQNKRSNKPIRVGVSLCLLGEKVRWDGGHKHDRYVTDVLGRYFEFAPVCPEVEIGMGVPRESVRLVRPVDAPRLVGNKTREDWTGRMTRFVGRRLRQRDMADLCGYILKKDSPSCGMERVRVYGETGMPVKKGKGFWGGKLVEHFPLLPVEEEGRLHDPELRENFIVRVFAYQRLRELFDGNWTRAGLIRFHTVHKYLLLAHSPKHYRELGALVADVKGHSPAKMRDKYSRLFMEGLRVKSTPARNANVLGHIMGFLKDLLDPAEKRNILGVVEDYRKQLVPLVVPLTLVRHYIDKHQVQYIQDQVYLNPHPKELMLRSHV